MYTLILTLTLTLALNPNPTPTPNQVCTDMAEWVEQLNAWKEAQVAG